jgi:antitoxin PrlF
MITSKIISKARTTIPQPVRKALGVKEGDAIAYAIMGNRVVLTSVPQGVGYDPFTVFDEWDSYADWRAYGRL